jgi:hypothetical protein
MRWPWSRTNELYSATLSEASAKNSSQVSDYSIFQQYVRPEVEFKTALEYYRTVGKVQNSVETYVAEILSRDWYFEGPETAVKQLEAWEEKFNLTRILEYMVRDWLVCGNNVLGISDWQPVQIGSIMGMKRNAYGMAEQFFQSVNGREIELQADKFIHTKFIEINREAWGIGIFHSLMTSFMYNSRKASLPQLEIYRRKVQLLYRILERYGSPVTIWFFESLGKPQFDKQVEELKSLEAGDRRILSKKVEIASETIDARGNLLNATVPDLNADIDAGLQSSSNRLITQPSAMADAREANKKDDAKVLYIAEKIRSVMNTMIIPKVVETGRNVEFKWGKQDSFEFDFAQMMQAKTAGLLSPEEGRKILQSVGWRLDDATYSKHRDAVQAMQQRGSRFEVTRFDRDTA